MAWQRVEHSTHQSTELRVLYLLFVLCECVYSIENLLPIIVFGRIKKQIGSCKSLEDFDSSGTKMGYNPTYSTPQAMRVGELR